MTDLQQERAQHGKHGGPSRRGTRSLPFTTSMSPQVRPTWQRPDSDWPDCRRATRSSTSPLGPVA